eukprot:gene10146-11229_t
MSRVEPSQLLALQHDVEHIRNFCILAHVDHGKTTLSDSLVSSNGIISQRLAGKLRFLDSTEEEQKRGITMHSSAIALLYQLEEKGEAASNSSGGREDYLINLVDSPGHIDFSSDVSTAARLCDGALVVVDVLEGVCTQTHAVIYKALRERMKPCLVLNKIDRLIVESRLSTTEAYHHLRRLIENVNALAFTLVKSELMKEAMEDPHFTDFILDDNHPLVLDWTFAPDKGNVQFASALDGWGFGLMRFVNLYAKKIGLKKPILRQYLFEEYYLNIETKKIGKVDYGEGGVKAVPMFAALVLEPLWQVYSLALLEPDLQALVKFAQDELEITLAPREANPRDLRSTLQVIMRRWQPLADSLLRMVVRTMPSPREAQAKRAETLVSPEAFQLLQAPQDEKKGKAIQELQTWFKAIQTCDASSDAPLVVFVSKMVPVRVSELSKADIAMLNAKRALRSIGESSASEDGEGGALPPLKPEDEVFLAVGRVFSGELRRSSDLFVLGNKYDPTAALASADGSKPIAQSAVHVTAGDNAEHLGCYVMLGPSVYPAESVPAGNIVGIVGLEEYILKTATLSSTTTAFPLKAITFQAKPMLKVAVDPPSHRHLRALEQGLQALYQFDPVVEIHLEDNGQWTMTCLGELHLDQCVKALSEKFMKTSEVKVSEPLVSFREAILPFDSPSSAYIPQLPPPWCDLPDLSKAKGGRIRFLADPNNANVAFTVRCFPLPTKVMTLLEQHAAEVSKLDDFLTDYYTHWQQFAGAESTGSTTDVSKGISEFLDRNKNIEQVWKTFVEKMRQEIEEVEASLNNVEIQRIHSVIQLLGGLGHLEHLVKDIVSIGPRNSPTNFLLFNNETIFEIFDGFINAEENVHGDAIHKSGASLAKLQRENNAELCNKLWQRIHSAFVAGFQETSLAGPLMQEPLYSLAFLIEKVEMSSILADQVLSTDERKSIYDQSNSSDESGVSQSSNRLGNISSGQVISEVKDHLRLCILSCPVRLVEPIYQCDLQCDQSQLGNLYAVLSKRRGIVFKEDIIEGTTLFLLSAYLPVVQSFHFAQELLKRTSGNGTAPQLSFSHWQVMGQDPFWRPRTEDELEEFGEQFLDEHNLARSWINKVRKRKGLAVDEQVVVFAEKQRTLNKKK